MKHLIIISFLLCISFGSFAQEKQWTLDECMIYAVENSPRSNKQRTQNTIYHQNYLEAIGQLLPNISASTSANFNFGRGLDDATNAYTDINSFSNNYNLSASLMLFDGLANYTKVRIGKMSKLMGKQQLDEERDMVAYDTMEAYLSVLYRQDMINTAQERLAESDKSLQQVKRMEELGVKGFPDVAEIEAKQAEDAYNLTKQKNLFTIAVIILKEKMNFPIEDNLLIVDEGYANIVAKVEETAFEIYTQSKDRNPKAQAAESAYQVQKLNHKAAKGSLMPRLWMNAGASTNFSRYMDGSDYSSFNDQFKNRRGEYFGFTLSIPLFNGFANTANVKRAKAQAYIAQVDRDDTLRKLYSEIEQAVADANGQVDEYIQAEKRKDAAKVAYQVNQKKYDEGLIDPIILHTSANRLLEAEIEALNAKYKYHLKYKLVSYYKGEPFITNLK